MGRHPEINLDSLWSTLVMALGARTPAGWTSGSTSLRSTAVQNPWNTAIVSLVKEPSVAKTWITATRKLCRNLWHGCPATPPTEPISSRWSRNVFSPWCPETNTVRAIMKSHTGLVNLIFKHWDKHFHWCRFSVFKPDVTSEGRVWMWNHMLSG